LTTHVGIIQLFVHNIVSSQTHVDKCMITQDLTTCNKSHTSHGQNQLFF